MSDRPPSVALRTSADGSRRVYARRIRWFSAVALLVLVACWAAEVSDDGPRSTAALVAGALGAWGTIRPAVVVEPGHVTLRRALRTRRLPAEAIARFEMPRDDRWFGPHGIRVVLRDGRVVIDSAFSSTRFDAPGSVGVLEVAELNSWLTAQGVVVDPYVHAFRVRREDDAGPRSTTSPQHGRSHGSGRTCCGRRRPSGSR